MWQFMWTCCLLAVCDSQLIKKGTFLVRNFQKCENPELYEITFDIDKRRLNRSHDRFNVHMNVPEEFTIEDYALHAEVYTKCDGGFKLLQNYDQPSVCETINKFGHDNFERALTMANIDPPNCPIPKGTYHVENYVFDYTELPPEYMEGEFMWQIYVIKGGRNVACAIMNVAFMENNDADDDDDDDHE